MQVFGTPLFSFTGLVEGDLLKSTFPPGLESVCDLVCPKANIPRTQMTAQSIELWQGLLQFRTQLPLKTLVMFS
jgi:hypothetical protein